MCGNIIAAATAAVVVVVAMSHTTTAHTHSRWQTISIYGRRLRYADLLLACGMMQRSLVIITIIIIDEVCARGLAPYTALNVYFLSRRVCNVTITRNEKCDTNDWFFRSKCVHTHRSDTVPNEARLRQFHSRSEQMMSTRIIRWWWRRLRSHQIKIKYGTFFFCRRRVCVESVFERKQA